MAKPPCIRPAPAPRLPPHRGSVSKKGSVLFWPKVEIKWDAAFNVIQDTFLDLSNDFPPTVEGPPARHLSPRRIATV